jgi:hypothetical protein
MTHAQTTLAVIQSIVEDFLRRETELTGNLPCAIAQMNYPAASW